LRKGSLQQNFYKKSLGINSYLKRTIFLSKRRFSQLKFGFRFYKKYKTRGLPYSASIFYSNQIFRTFYSQLKKKHLLSIFSKNKSLKFRLQRGKY